MKFVLHTVNMKSDEEFNIIGGLEFGSKEELLAFLDAHYPGWSSLVMTGLPT
jgi:hypothetical protein